MANKKTIALTTEQYNEIIDTMKTGFTGFRSNNRIATALVLEANLNELCLECKNEFGEDISKSGMKHRLAKVKQMAKDLKEDLDV